ncbi:phthiocerol/phthiodiolone dimycocerosyl transferase family protein [Streptomyces xanthophaeus]|uniref:phthiocerol/phthiodiolone dimycocerosyl transferase family protein n=1 Tax=Streptomyces xanthophaeus TaxID=67385 RepID=UPI0004CD40D7|nr:hypothetical protein [Streptomyces xanthophaeus]
MQSLRTLAPSEWLFVLGNVRLAVWDTFPAPDVQALDRALAELTSRHRLLGSVISPSANGWDFHPQPTPPRVTVLAHEATLDGALADLMADGDAPSLQAALLPAPTGYTLLLVVHHSVCDGQSSTALGQEFMQLYHQGVNAPAAPPVPACPLPPPMETLIGATHHPLADLQKYAARRSQQARHLDIAQLPHLSGSGPHGFTFRRINLSRSETAGILNAARTARLSPHALFAGAYLAAARHVTDIPGHRLATMVCHMPIDMRRRLRLTPNTQMFATSGLHTVVHLDSDAHPAAIGRAVTRQMHHAVKAGDLEREIMALPLLTDGPPLPITLGLANQGMTPTPTARPGSSTSLQGVPLVPAPFPIAAAAVISDRLHINLPYFRPWLTDDTMETLTQEIHTTLSALAARA